MLISDERFTQEQLDYEQLEEYFIKYMIEVVEHLYQTENMEIFKEILEFLSHRADKVVQFLLNAEKVKTITITYITKEYSN